MSGVEDKPDMAELDDSEEIGEIDRVVLVSEDGEELPFVLLAVVEHEGEDYAMLATEAQLLDDSSDEMEVFLFHYQVDEQGIEVYGPIEDDDTYEAVAAFCSTLMDGTGEE